MRRKLVLVGPVLAIGLMALAADHLSPFRFHPLDVGNARFVVTSGTDAGPGSLREAIFFAARSDERVTITLRTARIVLRTPLPPLVNRHGIVVDAEALRTVIDASEQGPAPVLDIATPNSLVKSLHVTAAKAQGILIRSDGVRLEQVTVSHCAEGILIADGLSDLAISRSLLEANGRGLSIQGAARGVAVDGNEFRRHEEAAVWAVAPRPSELSPHQGVVLTDNQFRGDRIAVVMIHLPGVLERNEVIDVAETGFYLSGSTMRVRGNRLQGGPGVGLFVDRPEGTLVEENEVSRHAAVGILLRGGQSTHLVANRVYANGYGIAVVFGLDRAPHLLGDNLVFGQNYDGLYLVGASPILKSNRALRNRLAGLHVLDFVPLAGPVVRSEPLLQENDLQENGVNAVVRGQYLERLAKDNGS